MGCTEPIAVAYCAAKARALLGTRPEKVLVGVSGNMIKIAKSVVVPNTGGLTGIAAAAAAGIVFGDEKRRAGGDRVGDAAQKQDTRSFLADTPITVSLLEDGDVLDILITLTAGEHTARARISGYHTNIVLLERDGKVIYARGRETDSPESPLKADRNLLTIRDIVDFADTVDLDDVRELIRRQIEYNTAIAEEGLHGDWGANIGSVILKSYGTDIKQRARAKAAAGSDARMSGCDLPVIINSGSGNQGITVSVPVIEYAREFGSSEDKLYLRWYYPTSSPSIRNPASGACPLTAARSAPGAAPGAGSLISTAAGWRRSPTRWSTRWRSYQALSATAQSPPARPRSPRRWTPVSSAADVHDGTAVSRRRGAGLQRRREHPAQHQPPGRGRDARDR
jgi:hypothetical protein